MRGKSSVLNRLTGRKHGTRLLVLWFGSAFPGCLFAQTPPPNAPTNTPASASAMTSETPLPDKVRGQVPFTAKYSIAGEATRIL